MSYKYDIGAPYQCKTTLDVRGYFRSTAFPRLSSFLKIIEAPRGCYADLPPVSSYKAEELSEKN